MDALIGWLGTVLGALGLLLALTAVPTTWADHHHAWYIVLWVFAILCLTIVGVLPLRHAPGWARFRWKVWRAAQHYQKHPPGAYVTGVSDPVSATGGRGFLFSTNHEGRRHIPTPARPAGVRITMPVTASVWHSALPCAVRRYGMTIFEVREFLSTGFVIADQSPGLRIEGEIFYSDLLPLSEPPEQDRPPAPPAQDSET